MKTTTLSLCGPALAALLLASPAAGVINFTFDGSTVPLKTGFTVSSDDNIDYGANGEFSITQGGLTLTAIELASRPVTDITPEGLLFHAGTAHEEDRISFEFDQNVTVESFTVGSGSTGYVAANRILVGIGGSGSPSSQFVTIGSGTSATPGTYNLPPSLSSFEMVPGTHNFTINGNNEDYITISGITVSVVPEPATGAALAGLLALAFVTLRRRVRRS